MAKKKARRSKAVKPKWHAVPLKGSFMVLSIMGFLITAYLVYPKSTNYGFAFMVVFIAMFIASMVSMTKAPISE
ncbi:MAG TPA: hypothetical protein VJA18_07405 [Candidatus Nanoarchaeia archaeon]|nr:hypothetical protein [Candidatus Nanoarchaeia archaeon]